MAEFIPHHTYLADNESLYFLTYPVFIASCKLLKGMKFKQTRECTTNTEHKLLKKS